MITSLKRYSGKSGANGILSVSTDKGKRMLVHQVTIAYSATPIQAGVTVNLDSGLGADYDVALDTGSANARYGVYKPTTPIIVMEDDVITVTAPAGGGVLTSAITILAQEL